MVLGLEEVKARALEILAQFESLPLLVVFDLDHTLWPFYCDCCFEDFDPYLFPQALGILHALKDKGIAMAIASRSDTPDLATTFLQKLGIHTLFPVQEIYPSWEHKTGHFTQIQRKTQVPLTSMLFFDDEGRNIKAVSRMGVTAVYVNQGVNLDVLRSGLKSFQKNMYERQLEVGVASE